MTVRETVYTSEGAVANGQYVLADPNARNDATPFMDGYQHRQSASGHLNPDAPGVVERDGRLIAVDRQSVQDGDLVSLGDGIKTTVAMARELGFDIFTAADSGGEETEGKPQDTADQDDGDLPSDLVHSQDAVQAFSTIQLGSDEETALSAASSVGEQITSNGYVDDDTISEIASASQTDFNHAQEMVERAVQGQREAITGYLGEQATAFLEHWYQHDPECKQEMDALVRRTAIGDARMSEWAKLTNKYSRKYAGGV